MTCFVPCVPWHLDSLFPGSEIVMTPDLIKNRADEVRIVMLVYLFFPLTVIEIFFIHDHARASTRGTLQPTFTHLELINNMVLKFTTG